MTRKMSRNAKLLATGTTAVSTVLLSAAVFIPRPVAAYRVAPGMGAAAAPVTSTVGARDAEHPKRAVQTGARDTITEAQVYAVLAERHPDLLRAPDPRVTLYVVANREGVVRKSLVVPLAQTHRAVLSRVATRRSAHITPDGRTVVGDRSHDGEPRAYVVPGRDVFRELQAEFGTARISSLRTWSSHAVPGGILVGWMTLQD